MCDDHMQGQDPLTTKVERRRGGLTNEKYFVASTERNTDAETKKYCLLVERFKLRFLMVSQAGASKSLD